MDEQKKQDLLQYVYAIEAAAKIQTAMQIIRHITQNHVDSQSTSRGLLDELDVLTLRAIDSQLEEVMNRVLEPALLKVVSDRVRDEQLREDKGTRWQRKL